jgi:methanogenic corrinoid protein MtbC1
LKKRNEAKQATGATQETTGQNGAVQPARSVLDSRPEVHLQRCISAVEELDAPALEAALAQSSVALGQRLMMDQVVAPLMQQVGDAWRQGTLRIVHEHMASAVVRTFLGQITQKQTQDATAPTVVVTTPPGQVHEIGAMMVAATATSEGWRVVTWAPISPSKKSLPPCCTATRERSP